MSGSASWRLANFALAMGKYSPKADLYVGDFLKEWILSVNGSDTIVIDRRTNLWGMVLQNLECPSQDWRRDEDRSGKLYVQLLDSDGRCTWNRPENKLLFVNENYRFCISSNGQASIRRYLINQLHAIFRAYMIARYSDSDEEPIRHAIGSFLCDFNLPMDKTMMGKLAKEWYRYRQKSPINNSIPIIF